MLARSQAGYRNFFK
jgi:hypothetical protein